jgi:alanine dehydrogenase
MIIGVPRETKSDEYRVAMLPVGVSLLVERGHRVLIEAGAGAGSGYDDGEYAAAGAELVDDHAALFERAEVVVKVKEPVGEELDLLRPGLVMFTFFHFAASRSLTRRCREAKVTALAYETLTDGQGRLPLLIPMSEVAGRMSIQEGAKYLEKPMMGRGILLGGVTGVEPGHVLILGAGTVGMNAAKMAAGLGADVTILDIDLDRLRYCDDIMPPNVRELYSDPHTVAEYATRADLVIGAVLIPGGRTPVLIRREMLGSMKNGAVIVDVGIDQGGCIETSRPTTHQDPTFTVDGVVHYCVANMPGAVGRTSTQALCHATQPWVLRLADGLDRRGLDGLVAESPAFASALNMTDGRITHDGVAAAFEGGDGEDSAGDPGAA